jgi:hypothetical protein
MTTRLEIAFGAGYDDEQTNGAAHTDQVHGLRPHELPELEALVAGASISVEPGGVGVGASGPGVIAVLTIAQDVVADAAALLTVGAGLRALIKRVCAKRRREVAISDPTTLGAVAAAGAPQLREHLIGTYFDSSRIVVGPPDARVGTDDRHIWASAFVADDHAVVIFVAPSGLVLSTVIIPFACYFDGASWVWRGQSDIQQFITNHGGTLAP